MKFILIGVMTILISQVPVNAQSDPIQAGVEVDVLPYLTGGYFGALWLGKAHVRGRALYARVHMPAFITKEGFTNNSITSLAVVGDYFLNKNFKGFWLSSGLVWWNRNIQTDQQKTSAPYSSYLLNGSLGYNFSLSKHFYLRPWAGMSLRVAGDRNIAVDDKKYDPPFFNPEISLKLGYIF